MWNIRHDNFQIKMKRVAMYINLYQDQMQKAFLFGTAVLYSEKPIPREDVPQYWHGYELRGAARQPDRPCTLVDQADKNFVGWILSPLPQTPIGHMLRPASPDEAGFFFVLPPEKDEELGAIGHVRIDSGYKGLEFWHTWWPRGSEELNTPEFKAELDKMVTALRLGALKDLASMRRYCWGRENGAIADGICCQNYGFTLETNRYIYRLRYSPTEGDYQANLGCFDKQAQKQEAGVIGEYMDITGPDNQEEGTQMGGMTFGR